MVGDECKSRACVTFAFASRSDKRDGRGGDMSARPAKPRSERSSNGAVWQLEVARQAQTGVELPGFWSIR